MTDKKLLSRLASLTPEQREALLKQLKKKRINGCLLVNLLLLRV